MTKITKYEPKTYLGKITGYSVELSDGTKGYLDDKASDKGLRQGDAVSCSLSVKQNKKGENYNLLSLRLLSDGQSSPTPSPTTGIHLPEKTPLSVNSKIDHKVTAAIKAMEFCMSVFNEEKQGFEWTNILNRQKECVNVLWSEIDEIYSQK
jgi:hypothetical protein